MSENSTTPEESAKPATAGPATESRATEHPESHRAGAVEHASRQVDPSEQAEGLGAGLGEHATGDIVIDAALQDLQDAPADDLDAQVEAGRRVQQTLQSRLSDLGGE